jgi:hypothetical protein
VNGRRAPGFERLGARAAGAGPPASSVAVPDAEGKRTLFSQAAQPPTFGSVTVDCSRCRQSSVVSVLRGVRLLVPSLHLPCLRAAPWSLLRCPACRRVSWVQLTVRL